MSNQPPKGRPDSALPPNMGWQSVRGFLAIGLALFLVTLACWRPPVKAHVAEAILELPSRQASLDDEEVVVEGDHAGGRPALDEDTLQYILTSARTAAFLAPLFPAERQASPGSETGRGAVWAIADSLQIATRHDVERGVQLVRVRHRDPEARRATKIVDIVSRDVQRRLNAAIAEEIAGQTGANDVASTLADIDQLNMDRQVVSTELESYVAGELERLRALHQTQLPAPRAATETPTSEAETSRDDTVSAASTLGENVDTLDAPSTGERTSDANPAEDSTLLATDPLAAVAMTNPDYMRLQEALSAARRERDELLKDKTLGHPAVLMVENKIRELQAALESTPRTLEAANEPASALPSPRNSAWEASSNLAESESSESPLQNSEPAASAAVATGSKSPAFDIQAARAEIEKSLMYRQLSRSLEDIDKALALAKAAAAKAAATPRPETPKVELIQPAATQALRRAALDGSHLAMTGLWATGIAFVLSILPGRREPLTVFVDPQDMAAQLGLKLVAGLPTSDGPPLPGPPRRQMSSVTRKFVTVAEWFLVGVVLTLGVMTVVDGQLGSVLLADPLQGYLQTVDVLRSSLALGGR